MNHLLRSQHDPIINDNILSAVISNHSLHDVKSPLADELKGTEHMQWKI